MSEARKRANKKWNEANPYERIGLILKAGEKEKIKQAAEAAGTSVNNYIVQAIKDKMTGQQ
jgi:uncharacterized protein (DUF1778 family)